MTFNLDLLALRDRPLHDVRGDLDLASGSVTNEGVEEAKPTGEPLPCPKPTGVTSANTGGDGLTSAHMRNWMECIRARKDPHAPIEAGYRHTVALVMSNAALRTGLRATFDEESRQVLAGVWQLL